MQQQNGCLCKSTCWFRICWWISSWSRAHQPTNQPIFTFADVAKTTIWFLKVTWQMQQN